MNGLFYGKWLTEEARIGRHEVLVMMILAEARHRPKNFLDLVFFALLIVLAEQYNPVGQSGRMSAKNLFNLPNDLIHILDSKARVETVLPKRRVC